jgi:hypothetical protein
MTTNEVQPADADYLAKVVAEIEEEVRARRAELPARLERELDELFLAHSPLSGRGGDIGDALRLVDAGVFIDPVVPVASQRRIGTFVKRFLRKGMFWYVGFVAHQISTLAAALSRALHILAERTDALAAAMPVQEEAPVFDTGAVGSWWVSRSVDALKDVKGRVLVLGCGDGWLVEKLGESTIDAYGVDPRMGITDKGALRGLDLREDGVFSHLEAVASAGLGAVVVSGVVDGMSPQQRSKLLSLLEERLAPGATLIVHCVTPAAWNAPDAPYIYDLAPGHPLRPNTWVHLLGSRASVEVDPGGLDYLVIARG